MEFQTLSIKDKADIQKFFEVALPELDIEVYKKKKKQLRAKYHPDNFEKFEDETIKEMATERFQTLETLFGKIEAHFEGRISEGGGSDEASYFHADALFAIRKLKIEIITSSKDLKYHLFGSHYRWLVKGEHYKIPETKATIIVDEGHKGLRIGFQETIRMYLTFGEEDAIEDIVNWLYSRIANDADKITIAGNRISVDSNQMVQAIKKQSFLRIAGPEAN